MHRGTVVGWLLGLGLSLPAVGAAGSPPSPAAPAAARASLPAGILDLAAGDPGVAPVAGGTLEGQFRPFATRGSHLLKGTHWLELEAPDPGPVGTTAVLLARSGIDQPREIYGRRGALVVPLRDEAS